MKRPVKGEFGRSPTFSVQVIHNGGSKSFGPHSVTVWLGEGPVYASYPTDRPLSLPEAVRFALTMLMTDENLPEEWASWLR